MLHSRRSWTQKRKRYRQLRERQREARGGAPDVSSLSICCSIIEAHGGQLRVSPHEPYGSSFEFTVVATEARSRQSGELVG